MPRHHRRKTNRWINEDCMQSAVRDICEGLETPSTAARKYGLKRTTIIYRVEKKQKMDLIQRGDRIEAKLITQPLLAEIFSVKQEKELMEYLNRYTYLPYDTSGSYKAARQLVYQFVKEHQIKHPKLWDVEQQAGVDWLKGFIQRNPGTNLRNTTAVTGNKLLETFNQPAKDDIFDKQANETESEVIPRAEPSRTCKNIALSEQSLESDDSLANSHSTFVESNPPLQEEHQFSPKSCDDMNGESDIELEPECNITLVNIKEEPGENIDETRTETTFESQAQYPKLDTVPENDDVFNSFGRNIAFQVKEMFSRNEVDALDLMHEVQTTVNRRFTNLLRLTKNADKGRIQPAKRARRQYNDDDDSV